MPNSPEQADVLVLGAGVAGLAAARQLSASQRVIVLEGRDRVGGRILTHRPAGFPLPIDLGPEFIHGRPKETLNLLPKSGLIAYDLSFRHFESLDGKLVEKPNAWDKVDRLLARLHRCGKKDCSFKEFLDRHGKGVDAVTRARAITYIEGFNASRHEKISVQSIIASNEEEERIEGEHQHRLIGGYDQLAGALANSIKAPSKIELNTTVREVHWSKGLVKVIADTPAGPRTIVAKRAVIALPLGVLQAAASAKAGVRFVPELPTRSLLSESLCMGQVIKFTLHCRTAFWEEIGHRDVSFIHAMKQPVSVWWTTHPLRTPLLTGWIGGARAEDRTTDRESVLRDAIASLAAIFNVSKRRIADQVLDVHYHDWRHDPYSLGAYAYIAVNGAAAPKKLSRPINRTLYFAGEHTHTGLIGTVAGAIQTGYRAAAQIIGRE